MSKIATQVNQGVPEIAVEELHGLMTKADWEARRVLLLDVRMPEEFNGELGHIAGSKLVTLGPELQAYLDEGDRKQAIVFVCRSGNRSGHAAAYAIDVGYENVANMQGGMLAWNQAKFPRS